jgi:hypothetical protein
LNCHTFSIPLAPRDISRRRRSLPLRPLDSRQRGA